MITMYSRENCESCKKIEERLKKRNIEFVKEGVDYYLSPHEGWREDGSADILAALLLNDNNLPVFKLDNEFYTDKEALIRLGL